MANEAQLGAITQFETFMAPKPSSLNNPKISYVNISCVKASKRVFHLQEFMRFNLTLNSHSYQLNNSNSFLGPSKIFSEKL